MFVCLSVCLFAGSPEVPLPWLVAKNSLWIATAIAIIVIWVGKPSKTIDMPRILGHLQLEVPCKPNTLLMLLYNRLNFEEKKVLEQVWGDNKRKDKNEGELTAYVPSRKG